MNDSEVVRVKGDKKYVAAVKAVASRYGVTSGVLVRDALDKVYGKEIGDQLIFFADNGQQIDHLQNQLTAEPTKG